MSNNRITVVPDFLGELDAGVFVNKIAAALNNTARQGNGRRHHRNTYVGQPWRQTNHLAGGSGAAVWYQRVT